MRPKVKVLLDKLSEFNIKFLLQENDIPNNADINTRQTHEAVDTPIESS